MNGKSLPIVCRRQAFIAVFYFAAITAGAGSFDEIIDRPLRTAPVIGSAETLFWHGAHEETLTIKGGDRALTRKYMAQYSADGGARWLEAVMRRGAAYLVHIRSRVAALGLPPELAYLPVVESAFSNTALSASGAAGLWQFMKNSIAPFGLTIDDWVDERRDFWLATEAALRKLKENYNYFQDWPLALAAYNAGLGAVQRAIQKSGIRDYWLLCEKGYLKTETMHYVPKFLAVATVIGQAGRLGLTMDWPENPRWIRIPVAKSIDLSLLAEYSGIPLENLRVGNAELLYGITPASRNYQLKVREQDKDALLAALARKDIQLLRYYFHIVRSGDTLSALARHYGVAIELIQQANPGIQARFLKLGQKIVVPALKEVGPYQRERPAAAIAFSGSYTVQKGDTLWSIALAFDIDPETLAIANEMDLNGILREGRVIKTPITISELP